MIILKKKIKIIITLPILILAIGLTYYFNYFTSNIKASTTQSNIITNSNKPLVKKINKIPINSPIDELNGLKVSYLNNNINFSTPLLHRMQRYYVPLEEFINGADGEFENLGDTISLELNNINLKIDKHKNSYTLNNIEIPLRGQVVNYNSTMYLCINDIEYMFSLRTIWNLENKEINFLKYNRPTPIKSKNNSSEVAVIRIEDVSAGDGMLNSENLEHFKTFIDYMNENNLKFNLGWIPRFVDPPNNIDNDLLNNFNINNACFINLLDYCINMNGRIGLHGYTHQYANEASISGVDLSPSVNNKELDTRNIIENAISTSEILNIPISFFESAHYKASMQQKSLMCDYFKYVYEPYGPLFFNIPYEENGTLFIPAPLGYVQDHNVDPIIEKLNSKPSGMLASFFYHPSKEFGFIERIIESNTITYKYSDESPMHKIATALNNNNYVTVNIDSL